ncbi:MAG: hypothetical protein RLZZ142_2468 [Verrucomicrobiota bacterium]
MAGVWSGMSSGLGTTLCRPIFSASPRVLIGVIAGEGVDGAEAGFADACLSLDLPGFSPLERATVLAALEAAGLEGAAAGLEGAAAGLEGASLETGVEALALEVGAEAGAFRVTLASGSFALDGVSFESALAG